MLSGKETIGKLIELSLGAIIGGFITIAVFGTSTLEYKDGYKEQYFDIPAKAPDELVIQHKGKKIENISVYDFAIYNRSFKDLKDVTVFFEVLPKDGKSIPDLISRGLYPPSSLPEKIGISEISQKDEALYSFKLDVVKQTGSDTYYLARFIFEGKDAPEIRVSIPKNAGVDINEYSNWREYAIIILVLVGMILAIVVISSFIDGWQHKGTWSKRSSRLIEVLDKTQSATLSEKTIDEITDNYEKEFKPKSPYFYRKASEALAKLKSNKNVNKDAA